MTCFIIGVFIKFIVMRQLISYSYLDVEICDHYSRIACLVYDFNCAFAARKQG